MIQRLTTWSMQFTFRGKRFFYNRIPFNNRAERAVEVPIAFDFLSRQRNKGTILEIGNVLRYYENSLGDAVGVRDRCIIDKFEVGDGIENVDIIEVNPKEKYSAIISVSTVEHVGQNCSPTGKFGEQNKTSDLEAPLKAIAKIYDLLAVGGRALLTVPFGELTDGGWYIQFSSEYLDLLITKYGIPPEAVAVSFLKQVAVEIAWSNPYQVWIEAKAEELRDVRYDNLWSGARAIAVIALTKLAQPFSPDLTALPTSLCYKQSPIAKRIFFTLGLLRRWLRFVFRV